MSPSATEIGPQEQGQGVDLHDDVTFTGVAHVAMTVSDMEATAAFWCEIFGFERQARIDEPPGQQRHPRILVKHPASGLVLGIHQPHGSHGEPFDPNRTGMDHLSLTVPSREALGAWSEHLRAHGATPSPERDVGHACFISCEDPDGIQIELWCPKP